ncbi:MAG: hypothetical protein AB2A00_13120 [Myxococcota bacterium]
MAFTSSTRNNAQSTHCLPTCEIIVAGEVTEPVQFVPHDDDLPTVTPRTRRLAGTFSGTAATLVSSDGPLAEGEYDVVVGGELSGIILVQAIDVDAPQAPTLQVDQSQDQDLSNACPYGGIPFPVPVIPSPPRYGRHHVDVLFHTDSSRAELADLWLLREGQEPPQTTEDGFGITDPAPLAERVDVGMASTRGIDETPELNPGETVRVAVRLVGKDGRAGPIAVSEPITINETPGSPGCTQSAGAPWPPLMLLLLMRRHLRRRNPAFATQVSTPSLRGSP